MRIFTIPVALVLGIVLVGLAVLDDRERREEESRQRVQALLAVATEPSPTAPATPPTPRGRCWLSPSRVQRLDQAGTIEQMNVICRRNRNGCVVDNLGVVWSMEEPLTVQCVAAGDGRGK